MKRSGPIHSSWRIPVPHVDLQHAAASSCDGNTFRSVKPEALDLLELMIFAKGICEESLFSVESHSSNVPLGMDLTGKMSSPLYALD